MSLAHDDAGADCAWSNEHGHGNCACEMLRLAPQNLNGPRTAEDELKSDKEKDHASKYLEGRKISLQDVGKNGVPKNGKTAEDRTGNQPRAEQHVLELPPLQFLEHVSKVNNDEKRVEKEKQQGRRSDEVGHILSR